MNKYLKEDECLDFLDRVFPSGLFDTDLINTLIPDGWESSPYKSVFHPSPEQRYEEFIGMMQNLRKLRGKKNSDADDEELPDFEEYCKDLPIKKVEPKQEFIELLGLCLWDIFSDNHEVIAPDGRVVDLGSQRGSAGFIADWINAKESLEKYDYMDFYMGTRMISNRADLSAIYRAIFQRLQEAGADWIYHFPQLYLFRPADQGDPHTDIRDYDPAKAAADKIEKQKKEKKFEEMKEKIQQLNREAMEEAVKNEPPLIVLAYKDVYGHFPEGWPPV